MTLTIGGGSTHGTPKDTIADENHIQMMNRLAKGMKHGTPGTPKGKSK